MEGFAANSETESDISNVSTQMTGNSHTSASGAVGDFLQFKGKSKLKHTRSVITFMYLYRIALYSSIL